MGSLVFTVGLFFLGASLVLFWLSCLVHAELLDDAILSLGFSVTALGLAQVINSGMAGGATILALLLGMR